MSTPEQLPPLKEDYKDEYGPIDAEVYQAAGEIWPRAVKFGEFALHDRQLVFDLMMKAVADVSRSIARGGEIKYLNAYLLTTFKRLVVHEREKTLARSDTLSEASEASANIVADLDRKLLALELFRDLKIIDRLVLWDWMRGYTHDEIAKRQALKPAAVGKRLERIMERLKNSFANTDSE